MAVSTPSDAGAAAAAAPAQDESGFADDVAPTRPRYGLGWVIVAVVFGIVVGLAGGLIVPRFTHPGNDSVEAGFLRDMSSHHAQAVEMAMIAHAGATDQEVSVLAADIALTQHGQINIMQTWLRTWHDDVNGSAPPMAWMPGSAGSVVNGLMPGMATPQQMAQLRAAQGKALEVQFLTLMRAHHLGGVHMAQEIVKLSDNSDVTGLAQTMVNGQQVELAAIQSMLARLQGTT
jgi:uncharacterized protein (DUF305 family)